MIVDADKVKEKLAKICDDRLEAWIKRNYHRYPENQIPADTELEACADAIRQADLSDCAVESQAAEEIENLETGNAILVDMVHKEDAEIARLKEDAERLDSIERNNWHVGRTPTHQWCVIEHTVSRIAQHPTLRGAIDSAKEKS